jgi:hypothetical protein
MQHSFVVHCLTAWFVIECGGRYWKCWFEHTFLLSDLVGFSQLDLRVNNTLIHDQFLWVYLKAVIFLVQCQFKSLVLFFLGPEYTRFFVVQVLEEDWFWSD